jgi:4-alpha-glucanotransferase
VSARHAGLLVPLFSAPSSTSWGIGELPDVVPLAEWLAEAGFDRLMLLPFGTMPDGETSPYSASSSMAIDPIYVAVTELEDFHRAGGLQAMPPAARRHLEAAVAAASLRHADVRRAKTSALDLAFEAFLVHDWEPRSPRAAAFAAFCARESWWLDDCALFHALVARWPGVSWRQWPEGARDRHPGALADARRELERRLLREQYAQWVADEQWTSARQALAALGVTVIGDMQFAAALESADVWSRAQEYTLDVSIGAPPDAFNADGQDWHLPAYRWEACAANGHELMRMRARRATALFDGIRIDHLVGLYRTYIRPPGGQPYFVPADEESQRRQGEAILALFQETGALLLAEDLGTVPDFVRASLARLGVPGTKVLRWERRWYDAGQPFIDPREFPERSVVMTGTHDTAPLASWWDDAPLDERWSLLQLAAMQAAGLDNPEQPWNEPLRDALLGMAWHAGSAELVVPVADVFGWRDRINVPGTVTESNWTWRLPWAVDALRNLPEPSRRARELRELSRAAGRLRGKAQR